MVVDDDYSCGNKHCTGYVLADAAIALCGYGGGSIRQLLGNCCRSHRYRCASAVVCGSNDGIIVNSVTIRSAGAVLFSLLYCWGGCCDIGGWVVGVRKAVDLWREST